jgi:hypothetical protein
MFYFRRKPFFSTDPKELRQFSKVISFRKELEAYGVLFWEYDEPIDFERRFREHLTRQILQLKDATPLAAAPTSPKLFLSYKREDLERVEPIYEALKAASLSPWMDVRDILPGRQWVNEVESAIKTADFFLTFVSRNTVDPTVRSATGFSVSSEVAIAREKFDHDTDPHSELQPSPRSYLIPVRLDPVSPPKAIASFQWIDLFVPNGQRNLIESIKVIWEQRG